MNSINLTSFMTNLMQLFPYGNYFDQYTTFKKNTVINERIEQIVILNVSIFFPFQKLCSLNVLIQFQ